MNSNLPEIWNDLNNKEYRDAFVRSSVFSWIAFQIRELREQRELSQTDLASLSGKKQSVISRIETSGQSGMNLSTLFEVASALDIALLVKFVPFSRWIQEYEDVSPAAMGVVSYPEEKEEIFSTGNVIEEAMVYLVSLNSLAPPVSSGQINAMTFLSISNSNDLYGSSVRLLQGELVCQKP